MGEGMTFQVGDVLEGTVSKVEEKFAKVEIGEGKEGILPISEISSFHLESASEKVSEGKSLKLKVVKLDDEDVILSLKAIETDNAWEDLEKKYQANETFEVTVKEEVKGGLVANVGLRAFIPASLVDTQFVEDFSEFVGKTIKVKISEMDKEKSRVILSRKAVLEEEEKMGRVKAFEAIKAGNVVEGTVQRITNFGVFIDLGGVDGLVHISQLSHERVEQPSEVVKEGETVKVKVLEVDPDNERISLSIKATLPGPWDAVKGSIKVGDIIEGKVTRIVNFGAFVEIEHGVEGLVHISQLSTDRVTKVNDVLKEGQTVSAKITDADFAKKRISLSIRALEEGKQREEMEKYVKEYQQDENTGFSLGDRIGDQLNKLRK
ncbi:30S ribosomal protein S1 [Lottiidibacillus patelloidae]|uniref:30S ribosomal protein S1 n=1 Tax=Lottiidibacillus patelloidae TaxID=2670334 RepID=A0A263BV99_9BACI|nr:30S ribosomal protein S1 [Lottiidibacillus patelloidae]OZM57257.1 30S ribosomal protein S1 [Lottiidibacillus patelloidae]